MNLAELIEAVGKWSTANFGNQETRHLRIVGPNQPPENTVCLDGLAPFLGMVEELGEFSEAFATLRQEDLFDAIGDQVLYFCDFLFRENLLLPREVPRTRVTSSLAVCVGLGKISHAKLKRFQGIRGFDDGSLHRAEMQLGVDVWWDGLCFVSRQYTDQEALSHGLHTWNKVVSKRDWKKSAADGGNIDHTNQAGNPDAVSSQTLIDLGKKNDSAIVHDTGRYA